MSEIEKNTLQRIAAEEEGEHRDEAEREEKQTAFAAKCTDRLAQAQAQSRAAQEKRRQMEALLLTARNEERTRRAQKAELERTMAAAGVAASYAGVAGATERSEID